MHSWFKNSKKLQEHFIVSIFAGLLITAVLRFLEVLHLYENSSSFLRMVQVLTILAIYINIIIYLGLHLKKSEEKRKRFIAVPWLIMAILYLFAVIDIRNLLFEEYSFIGVTYKWTYGIILVAAAVTTIVLLFLVLLKNKGNLKLGRLSFSLGLITVFHTLPLIIYIIFIFLNVPYLNSMEISLFLFMTITMNSLLNLRIAYGISPFAFKKLLNSIEDYVFIADIKNKVIFTNKNVNDSELFADLEQIEPYNPIQFFSGQIPVEKTIDDIVYFEAESKGTCFLYKESDLSSNDGVIGKYITFMEVTELIRLLTQLKEQQMITIDKNRELTLYKKNVYYLEKEKEINTLLEDIVSSQEKSMVQIVERINNYEKSIDDDRFSEYLDDVIGQIGNNLEVVRKSVSVYSRHYGGDR
jgi:hypothetical protein